MSQFAQLEETAKAAAVAVLREALDRIGALEKKVEDLLSAPASAAPAPQAAKASSTTARAQSATARGTSGNK
jgi:hypothetical protein